VKCNKMIHHCEKCAVTLILRNSWYS